MATAHHDHHDGGHHHGVRADHSAGLVTVALGLIVAFMATEVVVGLHVHSLALLADAGHMVVDASALGLSLWAVSMVRRPQSPTFTFGLQRTEIVATAVNGLTLITIAALIALEAIERLVHPTHVEAGAVVVVAVLGMVVNSAVAVILTRADRSRPNINSAFVHVITDLVGFAATLVAAVVIVFTHFERADPIASLVVVVVMVRAAISMLRLSSRVLLEGAPANVDLAVIRDHLLGSEHVLDVHDLHAWSITSDLPALTAHVVIEDECFTDGHAPRILDELQACLAGHFDVEHSTFQLEAASHREHEFHTH